MGEAFVSHKNQHPAVAGIAEALKRLQRDCRKKDRRSGKPGAVLLQDAVPSIVWIMLRCDVRVPVGKPQVFEILSGPVFRG